MNFNANTSLLVGVMLFTLSACTTQQQVPSESVQACVDKLPNSQLIKKQAVTTGCIVSAAIWKATGIGNPTVLICLAGGGAGYLIGKSVAERKCGYRIAGKQLASEIAHIQRINRNFPVLFMGKSKQLATQQAMVASLLTRRNEGKAKLAFISAVKKKIIEAIKNERYLVSSLSQEASFKASILATSMQLNNTDKTKSLQKEIALLHKNIRLLREENKKLYLLENKLSGL